MGLPTWSRQAQRRFACQAVHKFKLRLRVCELISLVRSPAGRTWTTWRPTKGDRTPMVPAS